MSAEPQKETYGRLVATILFGRGLAGPEILRCHEYAVRSFSCSECQEWAEAFRESGLPIAAHVSPNAAKEMVSEDGLCRFCNGPEELSLFVQRYGDDEDARDPASYTPAKLLTAYMYQNGLLKSRGDA